MLPATTSPEDHAAAVTADALLNLWHLQPALTGHYPAGVLPPDRHEDLLGFLPGDEDILRASFDFVGFNYCTGFRVPHTPGGSGIPGVDVRAEGATVPGVPREKTDVGWDIYPHGLYEILIRIQQVTGSIPVEITENGCAYNTHPSPDGRVRDDARIDYLRSHLRELHRAIKGGIPVRAYHAWSLLDNFEWAEGYAQRFGIVFVNFEQDQKRMIKDSGYWYAQVAATNRVS